MLPTSYMQVCAIYTLCVIQWLYKIIADTNKVSKIYEDEKIKQLTDKNFIKSQRTRRSSQSFEGVLRHRPV